MDNRIIQLYVQNMPRTFKLQKSSIHVTNIIDDIFKLFLHIKLRLFNNKNTCNFADEFKQIIHKKYNYDIKDVLLNQLKRLRCNMDGQIFMSLIRKIISKNSFINLLNIIIKHDYSNTDIIIDPVNQDIGHLLVSKKHTDFKYILIYKRLKDTTYVSKFNEIIKI